MAAQHLANGLKLDDDGHPERTGTLWSCIAHEITAIIGSGVLTLAWSVAQLGWIAGPVSMICFAIVSYISVALLSECYRNSVTGTRNYSYSDAVRVNLGEKQTWLCGLLQYLFLYGVGIAYVITTSKSMRAIQRSNCYHKEGHNAPCAYGNAPYMLIFGAFQIVISQTIDLRNMEWLSVISATMSFSYCFIGLGLGFAKLIENGRINGSITGIPTSTTTHKLWLMLEALGDIAYALPFSQVVLEIQDTLKSPPPENKTMKKASLVSISIATFFYLCCGCFGYAAFGNNTPGNLLTGFGFYEPYWLVNFANACIVLHLAGGYQIFSQTVFVFVERCFSKKFPSCAFVNKFYIFKLPMLPPFRMNLFRLCFRTAYVTLSTTIAIAFPYFNQVLGVLGAFSFWPLVIHFPVEMYIVQKKIGAWRRNWIILKTFSFACFVVTIMSLIGSIQGLLSARFG